MKVYKTAGITAVWRHMAKLESDSIKHVDLSTRLLAYLLGFLDKNSVATIAERAKLIDSLIKKISPKCVVEIGAGFSLRHKQFKNIKFYRLDLPYFEKFDIGVAPFEIGKDELKIDEKSALFVIEGVSMYLAEDQVIKLLKQIKKYKGHILIDFFDREKSAKSKTFAERIYKKIFGLLIEKSSLFDFRIENVKDGTSLLKNMGYNDVKCYEYNIPKTLDVLFYAKL